MVTYKKLVGGLMELSGRVCAQYAQDTELNPQHHQIRKGKKKKNNERKKEILGLINNQGKL